MTKRFKELYINEDGEVGLTNDGLLMVGTIKDLENLLNTLDEKSKELESENKQLKQRITELEDEDITKENKEEKDCLKCKYLRELPETTICGTNLTKTYICLKSKHENKEADENHYCNAYEERRETV